MKTITRSSGQTGRLKIWVNARGLFSGASVDQRKRVKVVAGRMVDVFPRGALENGRSSTSALFTERLQPGRIRSIRGANRRLCIGRLFNEDHAFLAQNGASGREHAGVAARASGAETPLTSMIAGDRRIRILPNGDPRASCSCLRRKPPEYPRL